MKIVHYFRSVRNIEKRTFANTHQQNGSKYDIKREKNDLNISNGNDSFNLPIVDIA